jgi:phosphohistidine swiveling domain-containing protein
MDVLLDYGFTKNEIDEIRKSLYFITSMALQEYPDIYEEDMHSLREMQKLRHAIREKKALAEKSPEVIKGYIADLLTSVKSDGTPQFSRQARLAFMARSFCRTLVQMGYIKEQDMDAFMLSINTVASDFERDFDAYSHGEISREEFNRQYGHLRLGTYNIRTDCYAKMYFDVGTSHLHGNDKKRPEAKELDIESIEKALMDYEISISGEDFVDFIRKTTENREYFKFEFTKSLSLAMELMIRLGEIYGIPREDLSFLTVMDLFEYDTKEALEAVICRNKRIHSINSGLILPEVIFSRQDIEMVKVAPSRPNFITAKTAEGEVVVLDDAGNETPDIEGKIVVITKADPGYDWIFTKNIAGFITRYGGAASHMAIRCAEFDIPAAIGCGEKIYNEVRRKSWVKLDCGRKQIS